MRTRWTIRLALSAAATREAALVSGRDPGFRERALDLADLEASSRAEVLDALDGIGWTEWSDALPTVRDLPLITYSAATPLDAMRLALAMERERLQGEADEWVARWSAEPTLVQHWRGRGETYARIACVSDGVRASITETLRRTAATEATYRAEDDAAHAAGLYGPHCDHSCLECRRIRSAQEDARRETKEAARLAARQAEALECATWAEQLGSERLRLGLAAGQDMRRTYRDERLDLERPGWAWESTICGADTGEVHDPALASLHALRDARAIDVTARLAWWTVGSDEGQHVSECDCETTDDYGETGYIKRPGRPILIGAFLGRMIVREIGVQE